MAAGVVVAMAGLLKVEGATGVAEVTMALTMVEEGQTGEGGGNKSNTRETHAVAGLLLVPALMLK